MTALVNNIEKGGGPGVFVLVVVFLLVCCFLVFVVLLRWFPTGSVLGGGGWLEFCGESSHRGKKAVKESKTHITTFSTRSTVNVWQ